GSLLLTGYNRISKDNGFWVVADFKKDELKRMCYGPYCYYIVRPGSVGNVEYPRWANFPRKARDVDVYLVGKMSTEEYPNWYVAKDAGPWRPLTNLRPEKSYDWIRSRLISWKTLDGVTSQGILYVPENFDSTKKYPLIFDYYEKRSDEFHEYLAPDFSRARINIPYFVSNGYLIFVPDIYYKQGHNGEGVYSAVVSAAKYLSKYSWVDSSRLGIQGHSFGGWETACLITHSNVFRAACEASGVVDEVSGYDELQEGVGDSRQEFYEMDKQGSPYGEGVTPWSRPD